MAERSKIGQGKSGEEVYNDLVKFFMAQASNKKRKRSNAEALLFLGILNGDR